MWSDRLVSSRLTSGIELAARFAEKKQQVLAENVANIDTPDYQACRLDLAPFQESLKRALGAAQGRKEDTLELRGNAQFSTGPDGRLQVRPEIRPAENLLFHDGTNARLERLLSDAARNALFYQMTTTFLQQRYQKLMTAIRGRVG